LRTESGANVSSVSVSGCSAEGICAASEEKDEKSWKLSEGCGAGDTEKDVNSVNAGTVGHHDR
jgi:hypothetical protein